MCDCIEQVNDKLAEYNTTLVLNLFDMSYCFVATDKKDSKKRGKPKMMIATFCPFCGVKYERKS